MMNKTHIALCICAGLLVVNTGFLFQISNRQKALEQQMANMQNQVMDSISVNTSSITQRLSLIHICAANHVLKQPYRHGSLSLYHHVPGNVLPLR